jgi:N-glycosylase/DNA lyase
MSIDEEARSMELTLSLDGMRPRMVRISQGKPGYADIRMRGRTPDRKTREMLRTSLEYILRLDEDLSGFYDLAASDPDLAWVTEGAGRMIRSATIFEEAIKTICTTNCAWSATERMVSALCEHLGQEAIGAPRTGPLGRAFPTPVAMAQADEAFYRDVMRAGYRGRYFQEIARAVAEGSLDLEALGRANPEELTAEELEKALLDLPGVGPYAAAHIMMTLGRYSRLILDSWTRPKYAKLMGRPSVKDAAIEKRFRRYGPFAGLAFWMFLTRDWVDEAT